MGMTDEQFRERLRAMQAEWGRMGGRLRWRGKTPVERSRAMRKVRRKGLRKAAPKN